MPTVSEAQRRAMWAAAEGHSTLGIPKSVGKEFVHAGMRKDARMDTGATAAAHLAEHKRLSNANRD